MTRERRLPIALKAFDEWLNMSRFWASGTAVDAYETETDFVVQMDVPGWRREDLTVRVEDNAIYISGDREETREVEKKDYYRQERHSEQIHEVVSIPVPVDPAGTRAKLTDGVLEITVPKTEHRASGVQIDIK